MKKNKTNIKLHFSPLSLFILISIVVGFCSCEQQNPMSSHGGLGDKEVLHLGQRQLLYYRDEFGDRGKNLTVDPSLVFGNPRLKNAYIALQAWKQAILSDPFNFTGDWVGSDVCAYTGVFCTRAPDNKTIMTVGGIDLNRCDIAGYLPEELGLLNGLELLHVNSTLLEGPLLPSPLSKFIFLISKNKLTGEIPSSICNFHYYSGMDVILDLSHNNLSGVIPRCLALRNISVLDLQMNRLHGNIPDFCAGGNNRLRTLNLNNNDFDGPLPKSLANCHRLEVLNLGNNKINDTFPHWLGTLPRLRVLVLRSNYFNGQLVHSKNGSYFSSLQILDLSHNEFSGLLPTTYFKSFQGMMSSDHAQRRYIGDDRYYQDTVLVTMKGVDFELERILTIFATLDMSSNRLEGSIPEAVGNLISLRVLNFSHNHLSDHIPSLLGNVAALESLDLSCNELVGEIPSQLTGLNFLEWLNLSENQLVGLIPQGKQFNTFLNDSYIGNSGLCGFPVSKGCRHSEPPTPATNDEQEADSAFELDWKFVTMGFGCGMVFGFSAGHIMMTIKKPKWLVRMIQRAGNKVLRRFKKYS